MLPSRARVQRAAAPVVLAAILAGLPAATAGAADPPTRTLIPIGSDYQADTLQLFARAAAERDTSGRVLLLVIPITYSLSAESTKNGERGQNLRLADHRRAMVEDACNAVRSTAQTCVAQLVPVLIRSDAYLQSNLDYFTPDVDGMYVLGGDQTVAMGVAAGTPLEARMAEAYVAGAAFGGNSAGMAVQSRTMINGYTGGYGPAESMRQGAVDLYAFEGPDDLTRGLVFGLPNAITDQHVFEYGRTGRSLNVAASTGLPIVAMDAATGGVIVDEDRLSRVTGDTSAMIIDPVTYGAAASYGGPNATLSTRGVAVHLLPPGDHGYDIGALTPVVGGSPVAAPSLDGRAYPAVTSPGSAAPLLLAGGIVHDPAGPVARRFLELAGGADARLVVLTLGYPKAGDARADAKRIADALQPGVDASVAWASLDDKVADGLAEAIAGATGILLTSPDRSRVGAAVATRADVLAAVSARWAAGEAVLLADDAAASVLGDTYVADPISSDVEASAPLDLLADGVTIGEGLGWVGGLNVQPRLLPDQAWGQLFRLAAAAPGTLAVGIDVGTALEVDGGGATALGESAVVVVDARQATLGLGTNTALAASWLVLDTFVDGELLAP